ncbi:hypothetical protein KM043_005096 [Ampulex compressa]|nr:hypothetical protein KM043_005096 [Ampulex compressa]
MSSLYDDNASFETTKARAGNAELEEFLMLEKEKARLNAQVHEFNDICWEKCVDKPGSKLDSRTEICLNNCVDRFIDVSLLITTRFAQLLEKSTGSM